MTNYKELLSKINTLIFDYDGVFTNNSIFLRETGEPLRTANVKDGYIIQLAVKMGYRVAIITGGRSVSIVNRFDKLNVKDVFMGVDSKIEKYREYLAEHKIDPENVLYMGDDIPDYKILKEVALATCPADASQEIKEIVHYISDRKGGEGCVRDIIEQVLKAQGKWMNEEAFQW